MRYAQVNNDGVIERIGVPPGSARRLDNGQWVSPPNGEWPSDLAVACGWVPIREEEPPPIDADTQVRTYEYQVNGARTVVSKVWTVGDRPASDIAATQERQARQARLAAFKQGASTSSVAELTALMRDVIAVLENPE